VMTLIAGTRFNGYSGDNGPAVMAQFHLPQGIAIDGQGNVFVADAENYAIRVIKGIAVPRR
jgi:hypothetical protein